MGGGWKLFHIREDVIEDVDVAVDLAAVLLRDALADPDDVAALLLAQLYQRVEGAVVELMQEAVHVQFHLLCLGTKENSV